MIVILAAMDVEVALLASRMEQPEEINLKGRVFTTGILCGHEAAVGASGVGKTNAANCAQMAIDYFKPDYLLHTGIAGSLTRDAGVLSIVLGEKLTFHDLDHRIMEKFFPFQTYFYSDEGLLKTAEDYLKEQNDHFLKGLIATGDSFIESTAQKNAITDRMPALCADMESAAVAATAYINGVPFLVVRAISDLADEDSRDTYQGNKRSASDVGAGMIVDIVEHIA